MAMFEQAMSMWSSFGAAAAGKKNAADAAAANDPAKAAKPEAAPRDDLGDLKAQLAAMQQKIEKLSQTRS